MPVVLVHGNPETEAIWNDLRQHLALKDVVTLSPPGFGAPVPDGFGATSDDYVDWLVNEVARLDAPVDLVGHDWGGGHVARLACTRPELIRSWTVDIAGCFDPEYVWHERAQVWQTRGAGEAALERLAATPVAERVAQFQSLGMTAETARQVAAATNAAMGRCILALYRSAKQPAMMEWGKALPAAIARPGLVIIPTEDHYTGGEVLARRSAALAGAQVAALEGLGHWWMCQDPIRGAGVLNEFFGKLA